MVEGADTGSGGLVWALNGANGAALPGWPQRTSGQIIGGIVTADLTGGGYNDVLVPTTDGSVIFDGRSAQVVATLGAGTVALQNSPLVTIDPNGTIGITIAGYNAANAGVIQHYEMAGSAGHSLGKRSWPMFHQNPQLTGWLSQPAPGHLNKPIVGHGGDRRRAGLLERGVRRRHLRLRRRQVLRIDGRAPLNKPVVGMAATPDGGGYWEVASDGGIFSFGDAQFYGSTGDIHLNQPIVGMAATPDGRGYWLVASDGGIFAFGDALFYGSTGGIRLNQPVVGMAATPDGRATGWWRPTVASSPSATRRSTARWATSALNQPVVGMTATPAGGGYWFVASDGGIFSLRRRPFYGSMRQTSGSNLPVVGMASTAATATGCVAADGGMFSFGSAPFYGSMPPAVRGQPVGVD